jgi:hypothetical protein
LWFAGASAMAGLINFVPRYLPAYGMAPEWGRAVRPVVLVYTAVSILITLAFRADVNAQAGAYATGILAMMVSAAVAVTISAARRQQRGSTAAFSLLTLILLYALVANVFERPDGLTISMMFIAGILAVSLASRLTRALELRPDDVQLDALAQLFIRDCARRTIRIVANEPDERDPAEYAEKRRQVLSERVVPGLRRGAAAHDDTVQRQISGSKSLAVKLLRAQELPVVPTSVRETER